MCVYIYNVHMCICVCIYIYIVILKSKLCLGNSSVVKIYIITASVAQWLASNVYLLNFDKKNN